jgi:hypothetical protein
MAPKSGLYGEYTPVGYYIILREAVSILRLYISMKREMLYSYQVNIVEK